MTDKIWAALFSDQIKRYSRRFFRLAESILRDGGAAEEACQQAYLKVWERRARILNPDVLHAILAATVMNESLQIYRSQKNEQKKIQRHAQDQRAHTESPEVESDRRDALMFAIALLPESERLIVVLRKIQGLSGDEAAKIADCGTSDVSKRLHRGLEMLEPLLVKAGFAAKE